MKSDKKEEDNSSSGVNEDALNNLLGMGFERSKCIQALKESNSNIEIAIGILFSKASDPDYGIETNNQNTTNPNFPNVWEFASGMGLNRDYVEKVCNHFPQMSPEGLLDYLLNNPMDDGSIPDQVKKEEQKEIKVEECWNLSQTNKVGSNFKLMGSVVHLGKCVGSGHYVSYARESLSNGEEKWVYYNDAKVYLSGKPRLEKSYIMLFNRM